MSYRIKRFSTSGRVILPGNKRPCDPMPKAFTDDPKYQGMIRYVEVVEGKKFGKLMNGIPKPIQDIIKQLRKSLKEGHLYDNGKPGEETHYKASESKPNKYHRLTKDINKQDRLEYLVYPPRVVKDEKSGVTALYTKVVLWDCILHRNDFKQKNWSEKESD